MKTGFKELDQIIDINEGDLIILVGRAGTGKSTLAFSIIRNVVNTYYESVLYFNLETSKETIMNSFIQDNLKLKSNIIIDDSPKISKETKKFIENNNLNKFTQNKAISKISDSYRVSEKEKIELKKYRK